MACPGAAHQSASSCAAPRTGRRALARLQAGEQEMRLAGEDATEEEKRTAAQLASETQPPKKPPQASAATRWCGCGPLSC